jgi:hypothetical protein
MVGTLDFKSIKKNHSGAAKKWNKRARSPEHLEPKQKEKRNYQSVGLVQLGLNFPKATGPHRALINTRGHLGAFLRVSRQREPGRLGNRALPGLLGRASGWLSSVTATQRHRFTRKNL